jgi:4-hydroxybenzoate polyprenyltransferase
MHAYSAIPDISPDKKQGIRTIATTLGKKGTLLYCVILYVASALLSRSTLGMISLGGGIVYVTMMITTAYTHNDLKIYKYFPLINTLMGMLLFFVLLGMKLG